MPLMESFRTTARGISDWHLPAADARKQAARSNWQPRRCALCDKAESEPRLWKLCARCGAVAYCSKEHQAAHWRAGHKSACRAGASGGASHRA